jgi:uncharacterized protein (TIGR01777 family)
VKKILITGATGGIGRSIVRKAYEQGFKINFLTTNPKKRNSIPEAKGFLWNPSREEIDLNSFKNINAVIHLSGASISKRWSKKNKNEIYQSRIHSTSFLCDCILLNKKIHDIENFVSASAIGIYPSSFDKVFDEKTEIKPSSFLEKVVFDWELASSKLTNSSINVVKLRIGLVLYNGGVLRSIQLPVFLGIISAFGSGKQGQSWIHIDDLSRIFLDSIIQNWKGVFNAVSPNPVNQIDFMSFVSKAFNRPYLMPNIPKPFIQFFFGQRSALILNSHWVSANKILTKGFVYKYKKITSALREVYNK